MREKRENKRPLLPWPLIHPVLRHMRFYNRESRTAVRVDARRTLRRQFGPCRTQRCRACQPLLSNSDRLQRPSLTVATWKGHAHVHWVREKLRLTKRERKSTAVPSFLLFFPLSRPARPSFLCLFIDFCGLLFAGQKAAKRRPRRPHQSRPASAEVHIQWRFQPFSGSRLVALFLLRQSTHVRRQCDETCRNIAGCITANAADASTATHVLFPFSSLFSRLPVLLPKLSTGRACPTEMRLGSNAE